MQFTFVVEAMSNFVLPVMNLFCGVTHHFIVEYYLSSEQAAE